MSASIRRDRGFLFLGGTMKVTVNGSHMDIKASTLIDLLHELGINPQRVVVEVNLEIIKRDRFTEFKIKEGDSIEIVNFVGGGQDE